MRGGMLEAGFVAQLSKPSLEVGAVVVRNSGILPGRWKQIPALNRFDGTLNEQTTIGKNFNKVWDPDVEDYVTYTVGIYTTDATEINGFGTVISTQTVGESFRKDEDGNKMCTGIYVTELGKSITFLY